MSLQSFGNALNMFLMVVGLFRLLPATDHYHDSDIDSVQTNRSRRRGGLYFFVSAPHRRLRSLLCGLRLQFHVTTIQSLKLQLTSSVPHVVFALGSESIAARLLKVEIVRTVNIISLCYGLRLGLPAYSDQQQDTPPHH